MKNNRKTRAIVVIGLFAQFTYSMQKENTSSNPLLWDILHKTTYELQLDGSTLEKYATQIRELYTKDATIFAIRENETSPWAFAQQKCYHTISRVLITIYKEKLIQKKILSDSSNQKINSENDKLAIKYAEKLTSLCKDPIRAAIEKIEEPSYKVHQLKDANTDSDSLCTDIELTTQKTAPNEWLFSLVLNPKKGIKSEMGRIEFSLTRNNTYTELHIEKLFITIKERRKGLGRALLLTIINSAKLLCSKNGIDITLTAQPLIKEELKIVMSPILIDYYQSFGFSAIKNSKNHMLMRIDKAGNILSPYNLKKGLQEKIDDVINRYGKNLFTKFSFKDSLQK